MKHIKEKENLIKMSLALGLEPDPKLVKEVAEYREMMSSVKFAKEEFSHILSEIGKIKVSPKIVEPESEVLIFPQNPTADEVEDLLSKSVEDIESTIQDIEKSFESIEPTFEKETNEENVIEPLDVPKPPTLDELMEQIYEVKDDKQIKEIEEKANDLIQLAASHIKTEVNLEKRSLFVEKEVPIETTVTELKKKIKQLEQWVGRISATGPGSGEVNLLNLDDVDTSNLGNQKYLRYNSNTQKIEFAVVASEGGASVTISNTAPTLQTEGDLWWSSDEGQLYINYDNYWIQAADSIALANTANVGAAFNQANTATTIAQNAFDTANTSTIIGQSSFDAANAVSTLAGISFDQANSAIVLGGNAFDAANTATIFAQNAFDAANNAIDTWVRDQANTAYDQANTATTLAQAAYDTANTKVTFDNQFVLEANDSITIAYTDGSTNESVYGAEQGQASISVIESGTPGTRLKVLPTKVVIDDTNSNGGPRNLEVYGEVLANVKVITSLVEPSTGALLLKSNVGGTGSGAYLTLSGTANGITSLVADGTGPITLSADTAYVGKTGDATLTTNLGDLILNTRGGTSSGFIRIYDQANGNINITPNGSGVVNISSNLELDGTITTNLGVDGTIESTGDVTGYAFNGRIGSITGTTINSDFYPIFVSAISPDQYLEGHLGLKYNPSSGTITANVFTGVAESANSAGYVTGYGRAFYRKNEIVSPFIASGTNYVIPWDNQDAFNISDFTHGSGIFTNTSTRTRRFNFQMTTAIAATGSGYTETDIWFSLNGTFSSTNRRGQIAYTGGASTSQLLSTSWTFTLAQNDTVRCYVWANDTYKIGHAAYGMGANNSCILEITEV